MKRITCDSNDIDRVLEIIEEVQHLSYRAEDLLTNSIEEAEPSLLERINSRELSASEVIQFKNEINITGFENLKKILGI